MATLHEMWARLIALVRRDALERDLAEELAAHIELATDEHLRRGVSAPEARRRALIALGGLEPSKLRHRESRGLPALEGLVQDVRHAVRALRRSPGFTFTAVATLAIAIGTNAAVFTVADAMLFKGYPLVRNDRLLYLRSQNAERPQDYGYSVSRREFDAWQAQTTSFAELGAYTNVWASLSDDTGLPENVFPPLISTNTFTLLEQAPMLGRDFTPSDAGAGAAPVVILSYGLWQSRYAGRTAVLGRTVRINGVPTTVIGVMGRGFTFPQDSPFWLPLAAPSDLDERKLLVFGRLVDGVNRDGAEAEMDTIGHRLAATAPDGEKAFMPLVWNFRQSHTGRPEAMLYQSMWWAVGFLLLIACANLTNLLLGRAAMRTREFSIRLALGAPRWRIVRQLLVESAMLAALGGLIGWWIATLSVRVYVADVFRGNSWYDFTAGHRTVEYLIAISAASGLLFGLVPALRLSRLDLNTALKDGGRGTTRGRHDAHASRLLVAAEVALTMVLLAEAGVMIRSFLVVHTADLGVSTRDVLTAAYRLPAATNPSAAAKLAFHDRLAARLMALPGVESVALANRAPTEQALVLPYALAGAPAAEAERAATLSAIVIDPGYFATLGVRLLAGRAFTSSDGPAEMPVVIVNEQFASRHWPGEDALGQRLRLLDGPTPEAWRTVVGVVSNVVQSDTSRRSFDPLVYVPYRQRPQADMQLFLRTPVAAATLAPAVRREVQALDPDLPVTVRTLADSLMWGYGVNGFDAIIVVFVTFAGMALLLACLGLYAVVAHSVSRRTQEIGVRLAVGATPADVMRLVVTEGLLPVGGGLLVGLPAALAVTPVLRSALDHVSPADPLALAGACVVLSLAAALGCVLPARRAMRVDPIIALRHE